MRNGQPAVVNGTIHLGADNELTYLAGYHARQAVELWHANGRWSDRGEDHPLDIVGRLPHGATLNATEAAG
jgi:hypothetical protein